MIAALYVQTGGCYWRLRDVDPWDKERDARQYSDSYPVVAHPPCERWGRYWGGGPNVRVPKIKGDDGGCFLAALTAVRLHGGVLEHPEASHAWGHYGLNRPPREGGWVVADTEGGWTCCVEQGHYGHRARKATWLYANGVKLPELIWGKCHGRERLDEGFHSSQERQQMRASGRKPRKRLTPNECIATPIGFRDLLLSIARSALTVSDQRRE